MRSTATPYVASLPRLCTPTQAWQIRLHAIHALTLLGKAYLLVFDVAKVAMNGENEYIKSSGKYLVLRLPDAFKPPTPIFNCEGLLTKTRTSGGE